jgi:ADP-heptose:LPS heptosyltransferase
MRRGRFAEAWRVSDKVLAARPSAEADKPGVPAHLRHVWTGAPLSGRSILVRCYHGLGDTIQFIRLTLQLKSMGCSVAVQAQPALMRLLSALPQIDRLVPLDWATPDPPHDIAVEVMELAHALRIAEADLPGPIPYLTAPETRRLVDDGRVKIGLAWSAGSWDACRSMALEQLRPLASVAGAAFFSLQRGGAEAALAEEPVLQVENPGDRSLDILDTAALIASLDLIVSVDTMVAHLAGAMARPVWLLLHHDADWRWMRDRADSPWYPTMRLFRQPSPGDWETPVEEIRSALAHIRAAQRSARF